MTTENKDIAVREKTEMNKIEGEPTRAGTYYEPTVDIFESKEAFIVHADMPGATRDSLDIDVKDGVLSLTATVAQPEQSLRPVYREYGIGGYMRRFSLSNKIDSNRIDAVLKDGVLTLTLPKADNARPRKIEIRAE